MILSEVKNMCTDECDTAAGMVAKPLDDLKSLADFGKIFDVGSDD